jgi:hypothetical protein
MTGAGSACPKGAGTPAWDSAVLPTIVAHTRGRWHRPQAGSENGAGHTPQMAGPPRTAAVANSRDAWPPCASVEAGTTSRAGWVAVLAPQLEDAHLPAVRCGGCVDGGAEDAGRHGDAGHLLRWGGRKRPCSPVRVSRMRRVRRTRSCTGSAGMRASSSAAHTVTSACQPPLEWARQAFEAHECARPRPTTTVRRRGFRLR